MSSLAGSIGPLVTRSAIAVPSCRRRALEPAGQPAQPAGLVAALVRAVAHAGCRDTRFRMTPEEMGSRLLYRDGLMLVIDKPAGLPVHRGPKGGDSLEDWFDTLRFGLPRTPALAHRLDKETSGCLVLGRHRKALADLNLLFRNGKVGKTYWAVVEGGPAEDEGRIDLPLGRLDDTPRLVDEARSERPAVVDDLEGDGPRRRHHLARARAADRAHPSAPRALLPEGFPVLGDNIYGTAPRFGGPGLHLHARRDRGAALQEQAADHGRGAGAGAHEGAAQGLRVDEDMERASPSRSAPGLMPRRPLTAERTSGSASLSRSSPSSARARGGRALRRRACRR